MPKSIVICCDGTANTPVRNRTNVMKLWLSLVRDDEQMVYYDPGVGTMGNPDALTGLRKRVSRALDAATGQWQAYVPELSGNALTQIWPHSVLFITVTKDTSIAVSGVIFSIRADTSTPIPMGNDVSIDVA